MKQSTFSIAVLSGKGGVGKSNIALNLAFALYQAKRNVLLMDCDMGLANLDILLGIAPEHSLQEMLIKQEPVEGCLVPLASSSSDSGSTLRLDLLPTESGTVSSAEMDFADCDMLCDHVNPVAEAYDYFVLDIGAGISSSALSFGARVDMRAVIVTPEPTSLTDGYALMKVMAANYGITSFHVIVNQSDTEKEGLQTYNRLAMVCEKFLQFKPELLGMVRNDRQLAEAVIRQKPLLTNAPNAPASLDIIKLASRLETLRDDLPEKPENAMALSAMPA